jgi:hypothetical protein
VDSDTESDADSEGSAQEDPQDKDHAPHPPVTPHADTPIELDDRFTTEDTAPLVKTENNDTAGLGSIVPAQTNMTGTASSDGSAMDGVQGAKNMQEAIPCRIEQAGESQVAILERLSSECRLQ